MQDTPAWEASYPPALRNYRLQLDPAIGSVADFMGRACRQHAARPAFSLVLPNGLAADLSFEQVRTLSDEFAAYLSGVLGLQQGEVLAIQLPNSLHYPIAVLGAWKAGLIVTNVNPLYTPRELEAQLRDSGAKLLLAYSAALAGAAGVAQACGARLLLAGLWEFQPPPVAQAVRAKLMADAGQDEATLAAHTTFTQALQQGREHLAAHGPLPVRAHEVALYQYTGGTTGRSKGAVLTHMNLLSVLQMTDDNMRANGLDFQASDVVLTVLPLYHIFAFVINFLMFFGKGARNVLVPNPRPLANLQPALANYPVTFMTGVDTLYAGLLAEPWFAEAPPKLRAAISGGTALRPSTAARWRERVGDILEGYGLTETSCIVSVHPPGVPLRAGSVGLPIPGSQVRVVDADGRVLPPGERGELQVRGPHIAHGYLNQRTESQIAFADGWFRTGDIVEMSADGYIRIVDRLKDMVLVSGFNVYPNEVEDVIAAHPDVVEVAVIGVPDASTGEALRAHVVSRNPALTAEQVIAHCRGQLTAYKVPRQVQFAEALPKSPVGKILRARLREAA